MDHLVILDTAANEMEDLLKGAKSMIIRGSNVKGIPYGMVSEGDILYFVNNNNPGEVKARGVVSSVYNSYGMTEEESYELIIRNQDKLCLPDVIFYKWAGKRYLVLIELTDIEKVNSFHIDLTGSLISDDWFPVRNIYFYAIQNRMTA
jgi:hypothetical protein